MRRTATPRFALAAAAALAVLAGGCAASPADSTTPQPSTSAPTPGATAASPSVPASAATRPALPAGFPVLPDASPVAPPNDDATVIARWTAAQTGSGPFDYYVAALPAAGYHVVGTYPSETTALIRFEPTAGTIWQLLLEEAQGGTRITIRTDRP